MLISQGALMPVLLSGFHFLLCCVHSDHDVNHGLLFLSLTLSPHVLFLLDAMPIPYSDTLPLILRFCLIHLDALLPLCSSCFLIWCLLYWWLTFYCCGCSELPKTAYAQVSPLPQWKISPRLYLLRATVILMTALCLSWDSYSQYVCSVSFQHSKFRLYFSTTVYRNELTNVTQNMFPFESVSSQGFFLFSGLLIGRLDPCLDFCKHLLCGNIHCKKHYTNKMPVRPLMVCFFPSPNHNTGMKNLCKKHSIICNSWANVKKQRTLHTRQRIQSYNRSSSWKSISLSTFHLASKVLPLVSL